VTRARRLDAQLQTCRVLAGTVLTIGTIACGTGGFDAPPNGASRIENARRSTASDSGLTATFAAAESTYYRTEYDSTRALLRSALAFADAAADSASRARALTWLGLADYREANYASARTFGEAALALKERLHLTHALSQSYNALGLIDYYQGRYTRAETLFTRALDTARVAGDSSAMMKALANLGMVWTDLGEFARARAAYQQARDNRLAAGDRRIAGNALSNLGMLEIRLGNPAQAVRVLTDARTLYDSIGYAPGRESVLGQIAEAYAALGDPKLAFAYTDSALLVARRYRLRQQEVDGLRHKALLFFDAGDRERALAYFEQARSLASELGLEEVLAEIAREEARVLTALGDLDRAAARADTALVVHGRLGMDLDQLADYLLVAEIAHRAGHRARSMQALRAAERERGKFALGIARVLVGLTQARIADSDGQPQRTLDALDAIRADLIRVSPALAADAFALRARAFERLGRLSEAAEAGRQGVAALELVRGRFGTSALSTMFTASRANVYGDLALVLRRLGRAGEALDVADAARGRALLEHLYSARQGGLQTTEHDSLIRGEELLTHIDDLVARLAEADSATQPERGAVSAPPTSSALLAELVAARRQYEELIMRAEQSDPRSTMLLGVVRTSSDDVRRVLRQDEAMLEYLVTPERLLTFVVRHDRVVVLDTSATPDQIAARVRLARDLLGSPSGPRTPTVLAVLHDLLIAPAERAGLLTGVRSLVVVPHEALTYLPFAALRDATLGQFLVEQYDLLTLPSSGALVALRRVAVPNESSGAAILAPFPQTLPGTGDEAREVARILAEPAVLGREAGERFLREALRRRAVVHVATHAVLNARSPMFSRLELSRGSSTAEDDGRFELHELLGMSVASDLVFLSGCETALGMAWSTTFLRGEDYATLAQAFLQAGASNVVATLWRIEDQGSAQFAAAFYRALGDRPPAVALAAAQRVLLRSARYGAPYYWAGYQIEGAGISPVLGANRRATGR